jgi:hypothetical protein
VSTDSGPSRQASPWVRAGGVLLLLVADGMLALALLLAMGWESISVHGFSSGPTTHAGFTM